jgi:broad specificity phosphatase PhoE
MPTDTAAELVEEFARCVAAQDQAIAIGDWRSGNAFAKRYVAAFKELRLQGDSGRDALAALLADSRAAVRVMAAAFLLRHCKDKARAVLEAEANGKGVVAFGASQALLGWDKGTWKLDPA